MNLSIALFFVFLAWLATGHILTSFAIRRLRMRGRRGRRIARFAYRYGYLKTPWWRAVSRMTKKRQQNICSGCRRRTVRLDAHHRGHAAYALLGREWSPRRGLSPLLEALCRPCHEKAHR